MATQKVIVLVFHCFFNIIDRSSQSNLARNIGQATRQPNIATNVQPATGHSTEQTQVWVRLATQMGLCSWFTVIGLVGVLIAL